MAHLAGHRELRFLFPIFPILYLFVALGLEHLFERTEGLGASMGMAARCLAVIALFAWPALSLGRELQVLDDPIYRADTQRRLGRALRGTGDSAGRGDLYWIGPLAQLHPRDYVFDPADETTSIYHFGAVSMSWWLGEPVLSILYRPLGRAEAEALRLGAQSHAFQLSAIKPRSGDRFVNNPEGDWYVTSTMPDRLQPLEVREVAALEFARKTEQQGGFFVFRNDEEPDLICRQSAAFAACAWEKGYDRPWAVVLAIRSFSPTLWPAFQWETRGGEARLLLPPLNLDVVEGIGLLWAPILQLVSMDPPGE
jgi:hypothetical protein